MLNKENSFALLNAINGSKATSIDRKHWRNFLIQLIDETKPGSVIGYQDVDEFEDIIRNSDWSTYEHPSILKDNNFGMQTTGIKGKLRQIELSKVKPDQLGFLTKIKDTDKHTFVVKPDAYILSLAETTNILTMILGIDQYEIEIVKAIFPGNAIEQEAIKLDDTLTYELVLINVTEAINFGFTKAMIVE